MICTAFGKRWTVALAVFLVVGATAGYQLAQNGGLPIPTVDVTWRDAIRNVERYVPGASIDAGDEIVLAYIGSSTCGWCNHPELPDAVRHAKLALLERARSVGKRFAAMGITRDALPSNGWKHLEGFGAFDEVMTGRSWANLGLQRYILGEMAGLTAVPQVLVLERTLDYENGHVSVEHERVLVRKVGVGEIVEWSKSDAPIPDTTPQEVNPD